MISGTFGQNVDAASCATRFRYSIAVPTGISDMPRRARITVAGVPHHVVQRGNNRSVCFSATQDRLLYLKWLEEYALVTGCQVHAYVLMTNHVHLLLTPASRESIAELMKRLGQRYVQYFNRRYERTGTLWEGRYRSTIAGETNYILSCYRYIELNPVRAGIVDHPEHYVWSSYRVNALGQASTLIKPQNKYLGLAGDDAERQATYRALFTSALYAMHEDEIRRATNGNYALGTEAFGKRVEGMLGRKATPGKRGRRKKRGQTPI